VDELVGRVAEVRDEPCECLAREFQEPRIPVVGCGEEVDAEGGDGGRAGGAGVARDFLAGVPGDAAAGLGSALGWRDDELGEDGVGLGEVGRVMGGFVGRDESLDGMAVVVVIDVFVLFCLVCKSAFISRIQSDGLEDGMLGSVM